MRIRRLLYWSNYTIVRWQLLLSAFLLWFAWIQLRKYYGTDPYGKESEELSWKAMLNFFEVIRWTILCLFSFSLFTALSAWLFFVLRKKNGKVGLQTKIGENEKAEAGNVPVTVILSGVLRPFLGAVRARMIFA
ncbi:MAG TPA: hypothetical protein VFJ43_08040, partial [Bacteroidia bacterium]|nr:hypothetical protein [Bacteroidia bacterium]